MVITVVKFKACIFHYIAPGMLNARIFFKVATLYLIKRV